MTLRVITGGAGTGKTTRLLALVDEWLLTHALADGRRALALTFMHGSRVRLGERLRASQLRGRFDCATIDSFANDLCHRWRTRLVASGRAVSPNGTAEAYDAICEAAAWLLQDPVVAQWVAATHPLVIVDEFQDCRGARPLMIESLSSVADVLVAADPFQDLNADENNAAIAMLDRSGVKPEELVTVHRTRVPALLAAAHALRAQRRVIAGTGLQLIAVPKHQLAAWHVALAISTYSKSAPVIISADRRFTTDVLERLAEKPFLKPHELGPYVVPWEMSPANFSKDLLGSLSLDGSACSADELANRMPASNPLTQHMIEWAERERRMRGRTQFSSTEVQAQIGRAETAHRMLPRQAGGRRAMTVHQAKNREFGRVIILWGFALPPSVEVQRRLLYNAITRAKDTAWVIALGKKARFQSPPFA